MTTNRRGEALPRPVIPIPERLTPDLALRLIALRVAAQGVDCRHCPYGLEHDIFKGCPRFQECLRERDALMAYGRVAI